jgi:hypothetical protein
MARADVSPSEWETAWTAAATLYRYLSEGHPLRPIPSALRLGPEPIFVDTALNYARYYEMDVAYDQSSIAAAGSLLFIGAAFAANSVGNANARRRAAQQAAPQWRGHCQVRAVVTGDRTLCLVGGAWLTFPHNSVVELNADVSQATLIATFNGAEPLMLSGLATPYLVTVLSYLLYGPTAFASLPYLAALAPQALPSARPALDEPLTGEIVEATDPRT